LRDPGAARLFDTRAARRDVRPRVRPRPEDLEPHLAMSDPHDRLRQLHTTRWRIALALTGAVVVIYFGFILLIAYRRDLLAALVLPGLSVGILLGALVIVASWLLTWFYVRWANTIYDTELERIRETGL
jgi:uncharacterized membrane protein (DUF485 family)